MRGTETSLWLVPMPRVPHGWQMDKADRIAALKQQLVDPLGLIDVGARWGIGSRWAALEDAARILCFDPDRDECERLNAASPDNVVYAPYGLAETAGLHTLHVTAEPACSSVYPPRADIYENYPGLDIIRPVEAVQIECHRLDDVLAQQDFGRVDAIKLDTQGSELPIMRAGVAALRTASFVEIEVEFNALYEGQPLFHQVDGFLREQGFVLWRFENLVHYSPALDINARVPMHIAGAPDETVWVTVPGGQLFWAQAIYIRKELAPPNDGPLDPEEARRAALLALVYDAPDLADAISARATPQK